MENFAVPLHRTIWKDFGFRLLSFPEGRIYKSIFINCFCWGFLTHFLLLKRLFWLVWLPFFVVIIVCCLLVCLFVFPNREGYSNLWAENLQDTNESLVQVLGVTSLEA